MKLACGFARPCVWRTRPWLLGVAAVAVVVRRVGFAFRKSGRLLRSAAVIVVSRYGGVDHSCGCTTNQSGGLARRATYIKQLAVDSDVIVATREERPRRFGLRPA